MLNLLARGDGLKVAVRTDIVLCGVCMSGVVKRWKSCSKLSDIGVCRKAFRAQKERANPLFDFSSCTCLAPL